MNQHPFVLIRQICSVAPEYGEICGLRLSGNASAFPTIRIVNKEQDMSIKLITIIVASFFSVTAFGPLP
ncbi:MAG: hypothetical protein V3R25_06665, partial [Nitrosomonadaceae bacterium]